MPSLVQNLSASCQIASPFDEDLVQRAAKACLAQLGESPNLVLAFVTSDYRHSLTAFLECLQIDGHASTIVGGSACGLIGVGGEQENIAGFSLLFLKLPSTRIEISPSPGVASDASLLFAHPKLNSLDTILGHWNAEHQGRIVIGGCATGGPDDDGLFLFDENGIARSETISVHLSGGVRLVPLVAHGCRPIGHPMIVTSACGHEILSLARQEPFDLLEEAFAALGTELQLEAEGHIFAGLALDEEKHDFGSGDFRIRQIVGATLHDGRLKLEAPVRTGQTLQFLWRDPLAAEMQLRSACESTRKSEGTPFAATLVAGKGRGKALFGVEDRNVSTFEEVFGKLPLCGFHSFEEFGGVSPTLFPRSHSLCGALFYSATREADG